MAKPKSKMSKKADVAKANRRSYRVFYVVEETGKTPEKIEVGRVEAADQADACAQLRKWVKTKLPECSQDVAGKKLYVEEVRHVTVIEHDGTQTTRELSAAGWLAKQKEASIWRCIWDKTTLTLDYWLVQKPRGAVAWLKDMAYFAKHG